tara:strand:+ start:736 stop:1353 length:618 start_codon:yes stop_codon:yes gene_type:complete
MIIIEDNFLKDPYGVRSTALKQKYGAPSELHYPGYATAPDCESVMNISTNQVLSKVKYLTQDSDLIINSSRFQYVTHEFDEGFYHLDLPDKYTCIIFLSPDPPDYSGTEVCDVLKDPSHGFFPQKYWDVLKDVRLEFHKNPRNLVNRYKYGRLREKFSKKNEPIVKVPNKFNRMILFDSNLFHRAQKFFGTSIGNSRLTLVTFFR